MECAEIEFGSEEYEQTLALRKLVLRDPLGLQWTEEEEAWEPRDRHFALKDGGALVACVVIRSLGDGAVKLRQMAVLTDWQGTGRGRSLLEGVEEILRNDGASSIELNARDTALGFYERLGFGRVGEEFVEVGIPHWKMVKKLGRC